MSHRIAVLSNVNMNFAVRMLARELAAAEPDTALYQPEGYGNELGTLLDVSSSYEAFAPDITFLIMDVLEAVDHDPDAGSERIESWFASLKAATWAGVWSVCPVREIRTIDRQVGPQPERPMMLPPYDT